MVSPHPSVLDEYTQTILLHHILKTHSCFTLVPPCTVSCSFLVHLCSVVQLQPPGCSDAFYLQLLNQFQLLCGQRALIKIYKVDPKSPAVHQAVHLPPLQYPPGPSDPAREQASAQRCTTTLAQLTSFPPPNQPVSTGLAKS